MMKRLIKLFACSLAVMLVAGGVLAALYWSKRTIWPEFTPSNDAAPQAIVAVEPDFGWRTGQVIPLTIYIKQRPDVTVDVNSLALEGDFELAGNPTSYTRDTGAGGKFTRIDLTLRSFAVKQKLRFIAGLSYVVDGQRVAREITFPATNLYTSYTYDGRPRRQEGTVLTVQGWYLWTTALSLVVGLAGMIVCCRYLFGFEANDAARLAQERLAAPLTGRALARHQFGQVWEQVAAGQEGEEQYKEIARILRRLYRIETRVSWEIPLVLGDKHPHLEQVMTIHQLCDKALYEAQPLDEQEKERMFVLFGEITYPSR